MSNDPLKTWETLFQRALVAIDAACAAGITMDNWSFGGGTVLMRRHRHRLSKDVDIFVDDPQYLGYLTPRLNDKVESLTTEYRESATHLKLIFPEGEIDFVVSGTLTVAPTQPETLFGRNVLVETSTEIVAKKIWYRGEFVTARDLFDLAMVAEREPAALQEIAPVLKERRAIMLSRVEEHRDRLKEDFDALMTLDYRPTFDACIKRVTKVLQDAG
jgi:hypothetical protein